ncbi:carotenoid biosynthesis protein [Polyangium sp. 15x6]|uniref:carotenoid biosynthesis protein n=1 Tax=Polyangium sp. 15x6 TaxID=3042687 RepID=UPI00249C2511|nr:carotenoid biosynthesis protein [Polyangium sp. 15x6]MDI3281793.1 carotenoid biosynthesis protein [Polyangium sp. 15x6]
MPLLVFEMACVVVVLLALAAMARRRPPADLLTDYAALAVAGWIGEETCVAFYEYYHYAMGWHVRLDRVPILVPLIWPLVILSAREVAACVWPRIERLRPLVVFAIVAFDASLVEVIAVRAGLWSWAEAGHLGVPIIGIVGWGYFAIGADLALSGRLSSGDGRIRRALATIVAAPLVAHALIQITWWGFFRWAQREALGVASIWGLSVIGAFVLASVVLARRRGGAIPLSVALPRMVAAGLFFVLLLSTAPAELSLWHHTAIVAIPYFAASELTPR